MLSARTIVNLCVVLAVVVAWILIRTCSTTDTVQVRIPVHRFATTISHGTLKREIPHGVDSSVVARIIRERDSLRLLLRSLGIRERVRYDTVIVRSDGGVDSIIVECDDIRRTAHAQVVVGERMVAANLESQQKLFGLYAEGGASYAFSTSTLTPRLSVGARLHFTNDISLVASGDLLIHGMSLQPAATVALRLEL